MYEKNRRVGISIREKSPLLRGLLPTGIVLNHYTIQYRNYKHLYFGTTMKNDKKLLEFVILLS